MTIHTLLPEGAAFVAGVMNAAAGGGTFLSFPALIAAGVSHGGVRMLRRVPGAYARGVVIAIGVAMTVVFFRK